MKKLILITATFFIINIYALPQCPSDTAAKWHNCFGTYTFTGGEKYVGDWKDGALHGQGVFTNRNGKKYIGGWKEGEYVPAICKNMGLEKGTKSYENCVLKLIKEINIDN